MTRRIFFSTVFLGTVLLINSCAYKLSFNGASIPPDLKTVNVQFFENNAPLVVNTLSQSFTEALKERIRSTTSLNIVRGEANATFSGAITNYVIAPVSIQATNPNQPPIAGASRLSITVTVKYTYEADKKLSFEETFTRFKEFTGDISSQENNLIADINKQLTEDIFNRAFANWN